MNSTRDRVISLLGQGFSQTMVATACGVTPSWVSQLVDEPEVREEIARLRAGSLQEKVAADENLDKLEKKALQMLESKLVYTRNPVDAARIFALLNKATRKTANSNPEHDAVAIQQVNIVLPKAAAAIHIQLNQQNQVIEVEGRSMATLPSRALPSLAATREQEKLAAPVPTIYDIQKATQERMQKQDAARAEEVLDKVASSKNLEVMINGVPCVL
jgi:hypothetical protein